MLLSHSHAERRLPLTGVRASASLRTTSVPLLIVSLSQRSALLFCHQVPTAGPVSFYIIVPNPLRSCQKAWVFRHHTWVRLVIGILDPAVSLYRCVQYLFYILFLFTNVVLRGLFCLFKRLWLVDGGRSPILLVDINLLTLISSHRSFWYIWSCIREKTSPIE